ncbi:enoyl-CoA hydratase/isomerase family protein [Streptantibioticus ferralitis]|uniref:Enoyl-CoA hydratase-related protein n=1 Tax=Streptantibioticus ferralitis TaxID=236510 RepID=A0ABT5ZA45_9ACTN|nr:enoyl-CoA hydratase-related protein [Streptantibioticus ferralitis]MDF2260634.1 enoyl-CoA hydratase-related protein [Streptantibioticus ferralitis]
MTSSPEESIGPSVDSVVLQATDNGVSWITLNRPEAMNAITWDQRERLIRLLADASADPLIRAVVITGTGRAFCAGADLRGNTPTGSGAAASAGSGAGASTGSAPGTSPDASPGSGAAASPGTGPGSGRGERIAGDVARTIRQGAQRLIAAVLDCDKPVIAAVNGTAAGIGAHLAFACDLVIAADTAKFIEVFVRRGLVPDGGGTYLLPRLIGPLRAKELMFFGDDLRADAAERLGLVNRVVPVRELEKATREWADRLASGPTRALALTKQLVNSSLESDRGSAFAAEAAAQEINMTTADAQEGIRGFIERRDPEFRGR